MLLRVRIYNAKQARFAQGVGHDASSSDTVIRALNNFRIELPRGLRQYRDAIRESLYHRTRHHHRGKVSDAGQFFPYRRMPDVALHVVGLPEWHPGIGEAHEGSSIRKLFSARMTVSELDAVMAYPLSEASLFSYISHLSNIAQVNRRVQRL